MNGINVKPGSLIVALVTIMLLIVVAVLVLLPQKPDSGEKPRYAAVTSKSLFPFPPDLEGEFRVGTNRFEWLAVGAITSTSVRDLIKTERVERLKMKAAELDAKGFAYLKDAPLRVLESADCMIDGPSMSQISRIKALKELFISDTETMTDDSIENLTGPPELELLELQRTKLSSKGLKHIVKTFPHLYSLLLSKSASLDDSAVEDLLTMDKLKRLDIGFTHISQAGAVRLSKIPSMESLSLCGLPIDDSGVAAMSDKLHLLELRDTKITDASLRLLKQRKKLVRADVRNCAKVGPQAIAGFKQDSKCELLSGTFKGGFIEAVWMEDEYKKSCKTMDKVYSQNRKRLEFYQKRLEQ
ncbi:MAG: hypothetical protein K2Z81_25185 [Cyanobacteria bacterium]|nr:hypothetical protein [Cyanobacteriota bacterium]